MSYLWVLRRMWRLGESGSETGVLRGRKWQGSSGRMLTEAAAGRGGHKTLPSKLGEPRILLPTFILLQERAGWGYSLILGKPDILEA